MRYHVIMDQEVRYDLDAHRRYQAMERFDPASAFARTRDEEDPLLTPRWALKQVVTISWLTMIEVEGEGLVPLRLETRGLPECTEKEAVSGFLEDVGRLGRNVSLFTWGGFGSDLPILLTAAMTHGLSLPENLRGLANPWDRARSPHIDLVSSICGGAPRVHMTEIAARMGLPAKVICRADLVTQLMEQGKWSLVKSVCECDVLTLTCLHWRHHRLEHRGPGNFESAVRLCRFVSANLAHRPYAVDFAEWQRELERQEIQKHSIDSYSAGETLVA